MLLNGSDSIYDVIHKWSRWFDSFATPSPNIKLNSQTVTTCELLYREPDTATVLINTQKISISLPRQLRLNLHPGICTRYNRRWPLSSGKRWRSLEFVQRTSARLLAELASAADAGVHGWSEQQWCTMAKNANNMTVRDIALQHRGVPFGWRDEDFKFSGKRFRNHKDMKSKIDESGQNKLYHPIKF